MFCQKREKGLYTVRCKMQLNKLCVIFSCIQFEMNLYINWFSLGQAFMLDDIKFCEQCVLTFTYGHLFCNERPYVFIVLSYIFNNYCKLVCLN